ncbi:hypothetical protein BVI2075_350016 [Burkholderia vietnamiensis]|nr:hypothetical protein BVI2075_350016 [Burkholderia vietnamiensis]
MRSGQNPVETVLIAIPPVRLSAAGVALSLLCVTRRSPILRLLPLPLSRIGAARYLKRPTKTNPNIRRYKVS